MFVQVALASSVAVPDAVFNILKAAAKSGDLRLTVNRCLNVLARSNSVESSADFVLELKGGLLARWISANLDIRSLPPDAFGYGSTVELLRVLFFTNISQLVTG